MKVEQQEQEPSLVLTTTEHQQECIIARHNNLGASLLARGLHEQAIAQFQVTITVAKQVLRTNAPSIATATTSSRSTPHAAVAASRSSSSSSSSTDQQPSRTTAGCCEEDSYCYCNEESMFVDITCMDFKKASSSLSSISLPSASSASPLGPPRSSFLSPHSAATSVVGDEDEEGTPALLIWSRPLSVAPSQHDRSHAAAASATTGGGRQRGEATGCKRRRITRTTRPSSMIPAIMVFNMALTYHLMADATSVVVSSSTTKTPTTSQQQEQEQQAAAFRRRACCFQKAVALYGNCASLLEVSEQGDAVGADIVAAFRMILANNLSHCYGQLDEEEGSEQSLQYLLRFIVYVFHGRRNPSTSTSSSGQQQQQQQQLVNHHKNTQDDDHVRNHAECLLPNVLHLFFEDSAGGGHHQHDPARRSKSIPKKHRHRRGRSSAPAA